MAEDIRRRVREETRLTCSCGIGPNRLLAKVPLQLHLPHATVCVLCQAMTPDFCLSCWGLPGNVSIYLSDLFQRLGIRCWVRPATRVSLSEIGGHLAGLPSPSLHCARPGITQVLVAISRRWRLICASRTGSTQSWVSIAQSAASLTRCQSARSQALVR